MFLYTLFEEKILTFPLEMPRQIAIWVLHLWILPHSFSILRVRGGNGSPVIAVLLLLVTRNRA